MGQITHGMYGTPEYRAFRNALNRCERPSDSRYSRYGARGIKMKFATFDEFFAHLGERPSPEHSLDRIDNDGHYEAGNVKWATRREQSLNKEASRLLCVNGTTRHLKEWSELTGIPYRKIWRRLKDGWAPEAAVADALGVNDRRFRPTYDFAEPCAPGGVEIRL